MRSPVDEEVKAPQPRFSSFSFQNPDKNVDPGVAESEPMQLDPCANGIVEEVPKAAKVWQSRRSVILINGK